MTRERYASIVRVAIACALFTAPVLMAGCGGKSMPSQVGATSTASFFPVNGTVVGWTRGDDVRTFSAHELSNYIDGDAEKYIKAGVQTTSTADYKFQNKFDAVADIYRFADVSSARLIYDSEPPGDAASPKVGDAARLYEQSMVYCKGRYLVRIVAYQASPQMQQAILDLGNAIEVKLGR